MVGGNHVRVYVVVAACDKKEAVVEFHGHSGQVIDLLPYDLRIYHVDDGSTDGTWKRIKRGSSRR